MKLHNWGPILSNFVAPMQLQCSQRQGNKHIPLPWGGNHDRLFQNRMQHSNERHSWLRNKKLRDIRSCLELEYWIICVNTEGCFSGFETRIFLCLNWKSQGINLGSPACVFSHILYYVFFQGFNRIQQDINQILQ